MSDVLVIVSSKVFDAECRGAEPGKTVPLHEYRSVNPTLDRVAGGGSLFLVTVRAPDEKLWLVAELVAPKKTKTGWTAKPNTQPVRDITALVPKIRFANGAGIAVPKGRLAMSLQTPRLLSEETASMFRGKAAPVKPKAEPAKPKAEPAKPTNRFEAIADARMEEAIRFLDVATRTADASIVPFALQWLDLEKWRSWEAMRFWVLAHFLLMRFGERKHLAALKRRSPHKQYSQMHAWLRRNRELVVEVIERRLDPVERKKKKADFFDEPLPKTSAKVMAHIAERIGDPRWKPAAALVGLVKNPPFKLDGEEGLHVYAALLLHGDRESLKPLEKLAAKEPMLTQILAAHGGATIAGSDSRGAKLLQSVLANPANDENRAVYADWLMEQGDARGEFIASQLAGTTPKLDERTAIAWAGDVGSVLCTKTQFAKDKPFFTPRYTRGFLTGAAIDRFDGAVSKSADWSTIEVIDLQTRSIERIADYELPSLKILGGLSSKKMLDAVLSHEPLASRLEGLGFHWRGEADADLFDTLLEKLPRLRFLALGGGLRARALFTHPLLDRLEVLCAHTLIRVPATVRAKRTCLPGNWHALWLAHFEVLYPRLRVS